eukprot:TRINITY_DN34035_c0_g1_i1.p1 TRINITY_DN34035_c0_g1~~TRINITY_DN34035_c0_g1_i1.p1  ORF type:complete len:113 (+),score=16.48 TRINITY_DN34035_c0_g1_i1:221-559(+)
MNIDFLIGVLGGIVLAYAAYYTIQYRALLKIQEQQFSGPPVEVVFQLLVGLGFCLWAALRVPGNYLPILSQSKENRLVRLPENLDFMIFNHRGKAFPPVLESKNNAQSKKDV